MPTARNTTILALLAMLAVPALAGCSGRLGADGEPGPVAMLETDTDEPFAGEPVTFDGQSSKAPGADIVLWRFDFGDGTTFEAKTEDEARVQHTYVEAGVYTVTLTVETEESDGERERDSTTEKVGVGDRVPVEAALVNDPLDVGAGANATQPVIVKEDATSFKINVTVSGRAGFGSSRVVLTFVDPSGADLSSKEVTVDAGDEEHVDMEGVLTRTGNHELRMTAESGAVDVLGTVEVRYDPDVPN